LYSERYLTPEAESEAYLLLSWPESSVDKALQEHRCTRRRGYGLATQEKKGHPMGIALCQGIKCYLFLVPALALLTGRPAHVLLLALSGGTRTLVRPRLNNVAVGPLG
jgi:hypothetical protein